MHVRAVWAYQDVLDAPEHRVAEIVDGTLHVSPRPPTLAALAKTRLSAGLGRAFDRGRDGLGGWWIFHEPELHFGEDVLVPDVTGWRRERMRPPGRYHRISAAAELAIATVKSLKQNHWPTHSPYFRYVKS